MSDKGLGYLPSLHVYDYLKDVEGNQEQQSNLGSFRRGKFWLHNDPSGTTAIGYGHNLTRQEIASGIYRDGITPDEADNLLRQDVKKASVVAERHFGRDGWNTMSQEQKDAAIDHAYNLGATGLKNYPRWSQALRIGDWDTVSKEAKRHYRNGKNNAWEPMSRRNAAYEAAFVKPNLEAAATQRQEEVEQEVAVEEKKELDMNLVRTLARHTDKNFVKRILKPEQFPKLDLGEGNYATHLMSWGELGDKYVAFPTVVQEGDSLRQLEGQEVWDHVRNTGEYIEFDTPEEAEHFSKNYKSIWEHRGLLGGGQKKVPSENDIITSIQKKYPKLAGHSFKLKMSPGKQSHWGGGLEAFHPEEPTNPYPGEYSVEVYDKSLSGKELETAVFGDLLHHMEELDPKYAKFKKDYIQTFTPEQMEFAKRRYSESVELGEHRPFEQWFNSVWVDAHMRGYLAPDRDAEWIKRGVYTQEQKQVLDSVQKYLKSSEEVQEPQAGLLDRLKAPVEDFVTQTREFLADWPRLGGMLMDISQAEKERLSGKFGVEDANKEALKVANAAVKTLAETIGPSEESWAKYAERHPILTDPKAQFLLAMAIPAMPKGSKVSKASWNVFGIGETVRGTKTAVKDLARDSRGLHAEMSIVLPGKKSKTSWSMGEDIEYSMQFSMDHAVKEIHVNSLFPENLSRRHAENWLEEGSNQLGVRELREIAKDLQERFPFIGDDWTVRAHRIGGRAGVMSEAGQYRKGFSYPVGRLAGKKKGREFSEEELLGVQKRINSIRTRTDIMLREARAGILPQSPNEGIRANLQEIERLENLLNVGKSREVRPSFDEWYSEVSEELQNAGILKDNIVGREAREGSRMYMGPGGIVDEGRNVIGTRLQDLDQAIGLPTTRGDLRKRLLAEKAELEEFLDDLNEGVLSEEHIGSVLEQYRDVVM